MSSRVSTDAVSMVTSTDEASGSSAMTTVPADVGEAAPGLGDHQVADAEAHVGVGGIEGVGAPAGTSTPSTVRVGVAVVLLMVVLLVRARRGLW